MNIKKSAMVPLIIGATLLTGCGSAENSYFDEPNKGNYTQDIASEDYDSPSEEAVSNGDASESVSSGTEKKHDTNDKVIRKEMLVYTCNMTVDVLDFRTALDTFQNNLDIYGAFPEKEQYSDGGNNSRWQYDTDEKWQTYYATIRVPSEYFNKFCDATADLGDLRSKNSNVENLSHEYYDLSTTLEIYEAKEKRYKDLLETITDEQYAITIENQLTDIQVEISKLKTRMNDIQTDVAYSFVNVTLNEVKEYVEEPVEPEKEDTFLDRLGNTVTKATSGFLKVMETLLFILIYLFPYAAVIGLLIFIIVKICKWAMKRKEAKYMKMMQQAQQPIMPVKPMPAPAPVQPKAPEPKPMPETSEGAESTEDPDAPKEETETTK